jgi:hypothetical protein
LKLPHDAFGGTLGAGLVLTLGCYFLLRVLV